MNTQGSRTLSFVVAVFVVFLGATDVLAEKTISVTVGEEPRCEKLSLSGKPVSGGYRVEDVWSDREGIAAYEIDEDQGLICFTPVAIGTVKIRVRGQRYELDRNKRIKASEGFYRAFKLRVRPHKAKD